MSMKKIVSMSLVTIAMGFSAAAQADTLMVPMFLVDETGTTDQVGDVAVTVSEYGLVFTPAMQNLEPGLHGFHVHAEPNCGPSEADGKKVPAGAAGGHWDPKGTGQHGEPWGTGHMGDLPPLFVGENGEAVQPVLAPRIKSVDELRGHALMVHFGGDNHSDHPKPLGGGGARMACGVIN